MNYSLIKLTKTNIVFVHQVRQAHAPIFAPIFHRQRACRGMPEAAGSSGHRRGSASERTGAPLRPLGRPNDHGQRKTAPAPSQAPAASGR